MRGYFRPGVHSERVGYIPTAPPQPEDTPVGVVKTVLFAGAVVLGVPDYTEGVIPENAGTGLLRLAFDFDAILACGEIA
jgi:hypothetical protein